jgi:hypothetical protein
MMTREKNCGLSREKGVDSGVESALGVKDLTKFRVFLGKADAAEERRVPQ